ncbi:succinate dehydrogenase assembly factor 3, mitochondrial [Leptinotarsa decemlineata]|uniref:succinate dehydrogenase assembly factor 3, mitochondrial n=1 Tax=Leptinotarsa decemlineata TaxID=7539 RepID=UPI003D306921
MNHSNIQRARIPHKTTLKLHRGLPEELQIIGTNYTRDEFKRHKVCSEKEAEVFIIEWTNYALILAEQLGLRGPQRGCSGPRGSQISAKKLGVPLSEKELDQFRDEQVHQLLELMQEATKVKIK